MKRYFLTGALALCLAAPTWAADGAADGANDAMNDALPADGAAADSDDPAITVTATRTPVMIDQAPVIVTVIDRDRIADELVTDIKDLVRFEPGVTVRRAPARFGAAFGSTGRAGNEGFTIRGIGGNRVIVQVDGIRVPDGFSFGAQDVGRGDYVDLGLVKSVEILRGAGSALYGSDGLSGVVSFITSDPQDFLAEGKDLGGIVSAQYSSADEEFSETAIVAGRLGNVSAMAAYTRRDFAELENGGSVGGTGSSRTLPNPQDGRSDALLGKIVWQPDEANAVRLTGEYVDTRLFTNVLTGVGPASFGSTIVDSLTALDTGERVRATLDWTYDPAANDTGSGIIDFAKVAVYWQDGEDRQFSDEDRAVANDRERLNTFENRVFGAAAELRSDFSTGSIDHRLVYGGEVSFTRQEGLRDGVEPPFGETFPTRAFPVTDFTRGGGFVADEISIGGDLLVLYPALRFDFYSLDPQDDPLLPTFSGAGQSGSKLSPKLGAVVNVGGGINLFGNYARGFKAPEPGQVNQFFENLAFGYTSAPNPDLQPETSESWEAGIRYAGETLSAGVTYFSGDYDDFISQEVVGGSFTPADPAVFQFVNIDRAHIDGVEARVKLRTKAGVYANLAAAYADGDIIAPDGSRAPLASIDPFTLVAGLGYRDPSDRFGGQLSMTFNQRKALDETTNVCTTECFRPDASMVLDATAFFRVTDALTIRAGIFNITDETYALWSDVRGLTATSAVTDAYTRPGRNASVSASFRF